MANEFLRSGTARTFDAHGKLISSTRACQLHNRGVSKSCRCGNVTIWVVKKQTMKNVIEKCLSETEQSIKKKEIYIGNKWVLNWCNIPDLLCILENLLTVEEKWSNEMWFYWPMLKPLWGKWVMREFYRKMETTKKMIFIISDSWNF